MRVQDCARPAGSCDADVEQGFRGRLALTVKRLPFVVDLEELAGGKRPFIDAGSSDRQAQRLAFHHSAEISARAERPSAAVERAPRLRQPGGQLAKGAD